MVRRSLLLLVLLALLIVKLELFNAPPASNLEIRIDSEKPTPFGWPAALHLIAGNGISGLKNGAVLHAQFADPFGIAIAPNGLAYIADAGKNNLIRMIDNTGLVSTFAGSFEGYRDGSASEARFHTPSGIAVDGNGNLYVADTGNHAIRKISPLGVVSTLAGTGESGFLDGPGKRAELNGPMGVAVNAAGQVFFTDTYNDRIRVIDTDGHVRTLAGSRVSGFADGAGENAQFDTPTGIALDGAGALWIADTRNHAIRRMSASGTVSTLIRSDRFAEPNALRRPLSLAVTHDGFVYVGEMSQGRVLQINSAGESRSIIGALGNLRLARPSGLALTNDDRLLVTDSSSFRVHQIRLAEKNPLNPARVTVGPAPDNPLPETKFRWPLAPQLGWHEVVGTMGEVRGDGLGDSRHHLHSGLDVRGDVGQLVFAIADAKVSSPVGTWGYGELNESIELDQITYVHLRVGRRANRAVLDASRFNEQNGDVHNAHIRVRRGTKFSAGDRLGTLNSFAHVHLKVGASGFEQNPMQLAFLKFSDRRAPVIEKISLLDAQDKALNTIENRHLVVPQNHLGLQIVVDAYDQVDRNLARRRLGLYALGYQWLNAKGDPLPGFAVPRLRIEFNQLPQGDAATKIAFAPGSGIAAHGHKMTKYRYQLSNLIVDGKTEHALWQPSELGAGDYILRISARDFSGNEAKVGRDLRVRIKAL